MIVIALVLALGLSLILALAKWRVVQAAGVLLMICAVVFVGYGVRNSCAGVAINTYVKCGR